MNRKRTLAAAVAVGITLLAACGGDDDPEGGPTTTTAPSTTSSTTTTTSTTSTTTTTTQPAAPAQPALWPAADVVLDTPEEAARGFVSEVLGVPPVLGEFRQGDSTSGELDVRSPGEGGGRTIVRSTLLLRRMGTGWFVIGAANDHATIESPTTGADVAAGPVTVAGRGRGFEGALVVEAFRQGSGDALDRALTQGGAMADPEPFSVDLDLSSASAGDVVVLLVRGGTGLEEDPGEFAAIPVRMA